MDIWLNLLDDQSVNSIEFGDGVYGVQRLHSWKTISEEWHLPPPPGKLHVIVQLPPDSASELMLLLACIQQY